MNRPNIVLIFTDQHRRNFLPMYGGRLGRTPALDALARDGVVFENAYTTQAVCTPARASVQTGLYPSGHKMQSNLFCPGCLVHELPDTPTLLSRQLRGAGYSAGYTGKWHLGYGRDAYEDPWFREHNIESCVFEATLPAAYRQASSLPTDLGYEGDDFPGHGGGGHGYKQYHQYLRDAGLEHRVEEHAHGLGEVTSAPESTIDHFLTDRAIHWIDELAGRDDPFFFALNYWGPHGPAYVPTRFLDPYRDLSIPPWESFNADQTHKPSIHDVTRNPGRPDWQGTQQHVRFALAYQAYIDHQIGRLLDHLRRRDLYEDTLLLFSADHGDALACHNGLVNKGFHFYEETATIPFVVKLPANARAGERRAELINTTDLYGTILDAAGCEIPPDRHGRSVLALLGEAPCDDWPDCVVSEYTSVAYLQFTQRMFRRGNLKYVWNCGDVDELYDLRADPHELRNLAVEADRGEDVRAMWRGLVQWMRDHNDPLVRYHWNYFVDA